MALEQHYGLGVHYCQQLLSLYGEPMALSKAHVVVEQIAVELETAFAVAVVPFGHRFQTRCLLACGTRELTSF